MAIYVQVAITDDQTGAVTQSFAQSFDTRASSWDVARVLRAFFSRVFVAVFGADEEWS